jgi:beta-ketoacyl-acyl-carrier-protein synthase II
MSYPRVVITGIGAITPIGLNVAEFWTGLISGKSGIGPITHFQADKFPVKNAAEVKNFDPGEYMDAKLVDRTVRATQMAIAATMMTLKSAQFDISQETKERIGTIIATTTEVDTIGREALSLRERGPRRIDPLFITKIAPHTIPTQLARLIGAKGINLTVNSACSSGNAALGLALHYLRSGYAEVMLAGGVDTLVNPLAIAGMNILGALSRESDPAKACRPFDLNRNGFIYGEGAGIVILETYEHAIKRGAPILAELSGVGWSFDACDETAPDPEQEASAMRMALRDAGVSEEEVDYINAHGTSTKLNDISETEAIKMVFGERAYHIPISSNKSMIGHIIAASAAIEAIASVLTINHGIIPPTINYETPDPECDLDYVPNVARHAKVDVCLSNSFGLGGQNCCLIIQRDR